MTDNHNKLSILKLDPNYPQPKVIDSLLRDELKMIRDFVSSDPFGSHVFPGVSETYPEENYFEDLHRSLTAAPEFHLWGTIPLCNYRCKFCQFAVIVRHHNEDKGLEQSADWVSMNKLEARLFIDRVPQIARTPVGEYNLFGGTPTQLPDDLLAEIIEFYLDNFNFTQASTVRVEGSPESMTKDKLRLLKSVGVNKLSYGIQSFDDEQLRISGRHHSGKDAVRVCEDARALGFDRISGDLIYGLAGQTVASFLADVQRCIALGLDTIVITKLHLLSFKETNTAIAGIAPAAWESAARRKKLEDDGYRWPSLGEIYQMREEAVKLLTSAGYGEHPTMYFQKKEAGPERWKSIMVDQDKQFPDVGIGLGASQQNTYSTASIETHPKSYSALLAQGKVPFGSIRALDAEAVRRRFVQMALSTCQPVLGAVFRQKFNEPLFSQRIVTDLELLEKAALLSLDPGEETITLSETGQTLVEAIINVDMSPTRASKPPHSRSASLPVVS